MKRRLKNLLLMGLILIFVVVAIFPVYYMIVTSFKTQSEVYSIRPSLIPFVDYQPTLEAWRMAFGFNKQASGVSGQIFSATRNSLTDALFGALLSVLMGSAVAYGLTRFSYGRVKNENISFFILAQRMFPPVALAMPYYVLFLRAGMTDKNLTMVLVYAAMNIPLVTWMLSDFFKDVPVEIEEAAMVDGMTRVGIFFQIVVPMVVPGIFVAFLFSFAFSWNEFLYALTLTFNKAKTLPFQIAGMVSHSGPRYAEIAAQATYVMIPMLVIEIAANKYIVRGLSAGALKS